MATLEAIRDDITRLKVDVIVNAANTSLLGGGGVDGDIHRAAGSELLAECRTFNGCKTGDVKISKGYNLLAKYVAHAVGPVWHGGKSQEDDLLKSCYVRSLELVLEYKLSSIAFPCISTGVYCFPKERAAKIALNVVRTFTQNNPSISQVFFVCFSDQDLELYQRLLNE